MNVVIAARCHAVLAIGIHISASQVYPPRNCIRHDCSKWRNLSDIQILTRNRLSKVTSRSRHLLRSLYMSSKAADAMKRVRVL